MGPLNPTELMQQAKLLVRRRERDCVGLDPNDLAKILANGASGPSGKIQIPGSVEGTDAKLMYLLYHHLRVSIDEKVTSSTRMKALATGRKILVDIDSLKDKRGGGVTGPKNAPRPGTSNKMSESFQASGPPRTRGPPAAPPQQQNTGKQALAHGKLRASTFSPSEFCSTNESSVDRLTLGGVHAEPIRNAQNDFKNSVSQSREPPPYAKRSPCVATISSSQCVGDDQNRAKIDKRGYILSTNGTLCADSAKSGKSWGKGPKHVDAEEGDDRRRTATEYEAPAREQRQREAMEERKRSADEEIKHAAEDSKRREQQKQKAEEERKLTFAAQQKAGEDRKRAEALAVLQAGTQVGTVRETLVVKFPADTLPTKSNAIEARGDAAFRYRPEALTLKQAENISSRFSKWDPFWRVKHFVACGTTARAKKVVSDQQGFSVALFSFSMRPDQITGVAWGGEVTNGTKRLILRMLPVTPTLKNRADFHLWPKGTFIVVNDSSTGLQLVQRKQQSHDHKYWAGLCQHLDLTDRIKQPLLDTQIKILTYEEQQYYFCVAVCEHVTPSSLYKNMLSEKPESLSTPLLTKLSREASISKAMDFTKQETVILDENDDAPMEDSGGKFVFTLTCPFSKVIMAKPVRGRKCRHYQVSFSCLHPISV